MGEPSIDGGPPDDAPVECVGCGFYVMIGDAVFSFFEEGEWLWAEADEYVLLVEAGSGH